LHRASVGLDRLALTLDLSLFPLEASELPGPRCAAGHDLAPVLLLLIRQFDRRLATTVGGGLLDGGVDRRSGKVAGPYPQPHRPVPIGVHRCRRPGRDQVAGQGVLEVSARQEAVDADRVEHHQDGDEGGQGEFQDACSGALMPQPRDSRQLSDLEGNAQPDDGPERAGEY